MKTEISLLIRVGLIFFVALATLACVESHSQNELEKSEKENLNAPKANFPEKTQDIWRKTSVDISSPKPISTIRFFDENVGYAVADSELVYRTIDGGLKWEKVGEIRGSSIRALFLVSPLVVFAAVNRIPESSILGANSTALIVQTTDGGKNWRPVYEAKSSILETVKFTNRGFGVAVGSRIRSASTLDAEPLTLLSSDNGENWIDISKKLFALFGTGTNVGSPVDVMLTDDLGIVVLCHRGGIYRTIDWGQSWELLERVSDVSLQTNLIRISRDSAGRLIAVHTARSGDHGVSSTVYINTDRFKWSNFSFGRRFFSDVAFLSNGDIVNAGSDGEITSSQGVVLLSTDFGKTWSVIHRSTELETFSTIASITDQRLIVGTDNGQGLILQR